MSLMVRIPDASRTSPKVSDGPKTDIAQLFDQFVGEQLKSV